MGSIYPSTEPRNIECGIEETGYGGRTSQLSLGYTMINTFKLSVATTVKADFSLMVCMSSPMNR